MTARRRRLLADLPRRGLAPRTHPCDLDAVTHLTQHDRRAPDQMRAEELRQSGLVLSNDQKGAERPWRVHLSGIRCVAERTRQRPWPVFPRVRPRHTPPRPVVWRLWEVRSLLAVVKHPNARRWLRLMDAWGRRLTAGTPRQVSDIDAQRRLVRVHQGHGGKDRVVPRAPRGLA
jgi:integrase/recombinase XerD